MFTKLLFINFFLNLFRNWKTQSQIHKMWPNIKKRVNDRL